MQFIITGDFAKTLLSTAKKDRNVARSLAMQFCNSIDLQTMGAYLMTPEVAMNLLIERLTKDPEGTVMDLQKMEGNQTLVAKPRRCRPPGRPSMMTASSNMPRRRGRPAGSKNVKPSVKHSGAAGQRLRLNHGQVEQLKATVQNFLNQHPWSTRMQIVRAAKLPTQAIYNRVMGELRKAGKVVSAGEKAKAVYALKGAKAGKAPKMTATPMHVAKKPGRPGRKPGRKPGRPAKTATTITTKTPVIKARKVRTPQFCPVPGCANKAAPVYGMLCKEHKDIPTAERERYFADRRAHSSKSTENN